MRSRETSVCFKFLYKQENGIPEEIERYRLRDAGVCIFKGGVAGVGTYCQASITVVCKGNRDMVAKIEDLLRSLNSQNKVIYLDTDTRTSVVIK